MARPRKSRDERVEVVQEDLAAVVHEEQGGRRRRKVRLPIYEVENGIDLSSLTGDQRSELAQALAAGSVSSEAQVDPAVVAMLIKALGALEASVLSVKLGIERDRAVEIVGPHPPLDGMIAETASKVIAKHNLLGRWGDEIALLSMVGVWQSGVLTAIRVQDEQQKNKRSSNDGSGPADRGSRKRISAEPVGTAE